MNGIFKTALSTVALISSMQLAHGTTTGSLTLKVTDSNGTETTQDLDSGTNTALITKLKNNQYSTTSPGTYTLDKYKKYECCLEGVYQQISSHLTLKIPENVQFCINSIEQGSTNSNS